MAIPLPKQFKTIGPKQFRGQMVDPNTGEPVEEAGGGGQSESTITSADTLNATGEFDIPEDGGLFAAGVGPGGDPIGRPTEHTFGADDFTSGAGDTLRVKGPQGPGQDAQVEQVPMTAAQRAEALLGQKEQQTRRKFAEQIDSFRGRERSAESALDEIGTPRQRTMLKQIAKRRQPFAQMARVRLMLPGGMDKTLATERFRSGRYVTPDNERAAAQGFGVQGDIAQVQQSEALFGQVQQMEQLEGERSAAMRARKALALDAERFEQMAPEERRAKVAELVREEQAEKAKAQQDQAKGQEADLNKENRVLKEELAALKRQLDEARGEEEISAIEERMKAVEARMAEIRQSLLDSRPKGPRKSAKGRAAEALGGTGDPEFDADLNSLRQEFPGLSEDELREILAGV